MKINKLAIYLTAFTIGTTTLSGCGKEFEYEVTKDGEIKATNTISYSNLSDDVFLTLEYDDDTSVTYITDKWGSNYYYFRYYDEISGKEIFSLKYNVDQKEYNAVDSSIVSYDESKVNYFLTKYGYLKEEYTIDDVSKYLEEYKTNYEKQKGKKLEKGKK